MIIIRLYSSLMINGCVMIVYKLAVKLKIYLKENKDRVRIKIVTDTNIPRRKNKNL